jgi:dTDP-4-dehydrorhamnose reductase
MENKKTILITGANGQLGNEFGAIASLYEDDYHFIFVGKEDLPINDFIAVECFFDQNEIDFCVNCAAYTAVDKAETEIEQAYLINETGVKNIATQCQKHHVKFIHISTDYVFDGTATSPITEEQTTNPLGVYGASKLKGEQAAIEHNPSTLIIRTSWVYSSFGNNFLKTMIRLMNERESINVVNDQIGKPTYARDLANTIMEIIDSWEDKNAGIYNFSNTGNAISWYDFACAIKESIQSKCIINPIPSSAYPTPAKRPSYSVLKTTKIENQFSISIPNWENSLERCLGLM